MFRPVDRPLSFRQRASDWIYKVSFNGKNTRRLANAEFSVAVVFAKWVSRVYVFSTCVCSERKGTQGKRRKLYEDDHTHAVRGAIKVWTRPTTAIYTGLPKRIIVDLALDSLEKARRSRNRSFPLAFFSSLLSLNPLLLLSWHTFRRFSQLGNCSPENVRMTKVRRMQSVSTFIPVVSIYAVNWRVYARQVQRVLDRGVL